MPFNSDTYHMNRERRQAREQIAQARDIKARAAAGAAYEWEVARIPTLVRLARISSRLSLSHMRLRDLRRRA